MDDAKTVHRFFLAELMHWVGETNIPIQAIGIVEQQFYGFHAFTTSINGDQMYVATYLSRDGAEGKVEMAVFNRSNVDQFYNDQITWIDYEQNRFSAQEYLTDAIQLVTDKKLS